LAPYVITLSVSERYGLSLIAKRRFSVSETASLSFRRYKGTKNKDAKQYFPSIIFKYFSANILSFLSDITPYHRITVP